MCFPSKKGQLMDKVKICLPGMFDVLGVSEASLGLTVDEKPHLVHLLELVENAQQLNNCSVDITHNPIQHCYNGLCLLTIVCVTGMHYGVSTEHEQHQHKMAEGVASFLYCTGKQWKHWIIININCITWNQTITLYDYFTYFLRLYNTTV